MFLDPDPKRGSKQGLRGMSAPSGFFSSQRPVVSPRDHRTTIRRKTQPLGERTPSQNNQQNPWADPANSTVRIVKPSPLRLADASSDAEDSEHSEHDEDIAEVKQNIQGQQVSTGHAAVKPASVSNAGLTGFSTSSLAKSVSGSDTPDNASQHIGPFDASSLLYTTPAQVHYHAPHALPRSAWHRRSGSTGNYSTSSTLKGPDDSGIFIPSIEKADIRLSQGTTVRGTPPPPDQDVRQRIEAEEHARHASAQTLETLPETSPERSALRAVELSSEDSGSVDDPSEPASSPNFRVFASPSSSEVDPRSSWDQLSDSSPTRPRRSSDTRVPRNASSQETIIHHEASIPPSSSPNYVAYSPDSTRPRSGTYPLHRTYSVESIDSRLQYPTVTRPQTGLSLASTTSWSSLRPISSGDQLAPLYVPKKRLRHKAASSSLNAAARAFSSGETMADEDIDTEPYPREPFSSHLSTIASESERTGSQRLSHFSLGSGVLTGDDASSIPLSGTWPRRRRESAPVSSMASDLPLQASSEEEAGDMTLGVFREESAKPQPLFESKAPATPADQKKYDGPLPPLPPIPNSPETDERNDRATDLPGGHQLRAKKSGHSLRRRSNSTPSRGHSRHLSRSESERWSQASSLFPTWAKNFYGNGAALMSASKISLTGAPDLQRRNLHQRTESHWTERSITSRLGTGYSEVPNPSPTSSHFLPSIFRPRARKNSKNDSSSRHRKSKRSRPSGDSLSRPDSLQIFAEPIPEPQQPDGTTLPSGHPKYGSLKDDSERPRPLPRKYSKQKMWNDMQFPRPMTKDRLSDFHMDIESQPHLAPSKRASRLSVWRAPSFVESLDTLLKSRCNRQILLFALGFVCPLLWMVGAVLPIPKKPISAENLQEASMTGSEDDIQAAMMKHEAGDAERRWREEKAWLKGRWWRWLNRIMSLIGVGVIGAVIALAVIATR